MDDCQVFMKRFLFLLSIVLFQNAVNADWIGKKNLLGKYKSKIEAGIACADWSNKNDKNYFYLEDQEDYRIGKIYDDLEKENVYNLRGILKSKDLWNGYTFSYRTTCFHEEDTNQYIGLGWGKNLNKNKIHSLKKIENAWGKYYYFKY